MQDYKMSKPKQEIQLNSNSKNIYEKSKVLYLSKSKQTPILTILPLLYIFFQLIDYGYANKEPLNIQKKNLLDYTNLQKAPYSPVSYA